MGTRIEPSLKARWDAAAESAGISGSAQLNLAIEDYLGVHEERHRHQDVVQELRDIERRLLDTARVLLEAHEAQRTRMAQLETMVGRLGQILESQESRFVNIEDLRGLLFGDEPSSDDDGESVVPSHDFGAPHLRAETECAEIRREHQ